MNIFVKTVILLTLISQNGAFSLASAADNTEARVRQAQKSLKSEKYDDCVEILKPVYLQLSLNGLVVLERCYQGNKRYLNQIRVLEQIISIEPRNLQAKSRLAQAYFDIEKSDQAISLLRELISTNPSFIPGYEALYKIFQAEHNNYESRIILEDLIQKFGKKAEWTTQLCRLYAIDEFHTAALDWCKQAVQLDSAIADNHVYLGNAYKGLNNDKQGDKILLAAGKRFKKSELALWAAGTIALKSNRHREALGYFEHCQKVDPNSARCMIGLGKAAVETGQYQKALDTFTTACKNHPGVLPAFKEASRDLHQKANPSWQRKFTEAHLGCRH